MPLWRYCASLSLVFLLVMACASPTPGPTTSIRETPDQGTLPATPSSPDSPSATATPIAPAADFDQRAGEYLSILVKDTSPRESATEQERQAARYLAKEFESLGYSTEFHEFDLTMVTPESSSLTTSPGYPEPIGVIPLRGSAAAESAGSLMAVGLARPENVAEGSLNGKVALVQRGEITFQAKVEAVARAGAIAAVIYNNQPGNFHGSLRGRSAIPVASISQEEGKRLLELIAQGDVQAALSVQEATLPSRNLIAELPGGQGDVVVLGAHYDTVADTQGANDNTSGLASLLILAEELASRELPFRVRFIAFGAEELGLFGSRAYVETLDDEQLDEIVAMLNYDALGSGGSIALEGSRRLSRLGASVADSRGIDVTVEQEEAVRGTSDHASFSRYDIPALLFTAPDYSRINSPEDSLEFVEPNLVGDAVKLTLALLESDGFPP